MPLHPGFLLGVNRINKQLARLRMNYISLNDFLGRHRVDGQTHRYCEPCYALLADHKVNQTSEHHLLDCKVYNRDRATLFKTVNSLPNYFPNYELSFADLLRPTKKHWTDIKIANAICLYIEATTGSGKLL